MRKNVKGKIICDLDSRQGWLWAAQTVGEWGWDHGQAKKTPETADKLIRSLQEQAVLVNPRASHRRQLRHVYSAAYWAGRAAKLGKDIYSI
jgi:hypothetical protein